MAPCKLDPMTISAIRLIDAHIRRRQCSPFHLIEIDSVHCSAQRLDNTQNRFSRNRKLCEPNGDVTCVRIVQMSGLLNFTMFFSDAKTFILSRVNVSRLITSFTAVPLFPVYTEAIVFYEKTFLDSFFPPYFPAHLFRFSNTDYKT